jgi:hypothetical protein
MLQYKKTRKATFENKCTYVPVMLSTHLSRRRVTVGSNPCLMSSKFHSRNTIAQSGRPALITNPDLT